MYNFGMLTEEQIAKIRDYCTDRPIEVVYVFGSQTTDKANHLSDYDFGVLFDKEITSGQRFDLVVDMMGFLGGVTGFGDRVDVVDLNRAPIRFQYEAMEPRREVYVRSKRVMDEFEYRVLQKYSDEMYFLKQATRAEVAAIAKYGFGNM